MSKKININDKLKKVTLDKHNFFMRNVTKGNDSILGQSSHPCRQKQILARTLKKKIYEENFRKMNHKKLRTINSQKRRQNKIIPDKENLSIYVKPELPLLQISQNIFAFGSSVINQSADFKNEDPELTNKNEYKKFQFRKKLGKQYLKELKSIRKTNLGILEPQNTEIIQTEPIEHFIPVVEKFNTETTEKETVYKAQKKIYKIPKLKQKKVFVIKESDVKRKPNRKSPKKKKQYINYLNEFKKGILFNLLFG